MLKNRVPQDCRTELLEAANRFFNDNRGRLNILCCDRRGLERRIRAET